MSDQRQPDSTHQALPPGAPSQMNRRGFFRGAAALTVGGLAAPAALAQTTAPSSQAARAPQNAEGNRELAEQTNRSLRWAGRDPADWVPPRAGVDHNVVVVGGGQSGLAIAYALKRKGVGKVDVIDLAEPDKLASGAALRA